MKRLKKECEVKVDYPTAKIAWEDRDWETSLLVV